MTKTHWLKNPNKNYLGNWDLPESGELTLTIKSAGWEMVKNPINGQTQEKRIVHFVEDYKPLICNEINAKSITKATGEYFMENSIGKKITLFVTQIFDRKEKETINVVRIREIPPKVKEKPTLEKDTETFNTVKTYLKKGYTIEQVKKKYIVSQEVEKALLEAVKEQLTPESESWNKIKELLKSGELTLDGKEGIETIYNISENHLEQLRDECMNEFSENK